MLDSQKWRRFKVLSTQKKFWFGGELGRLTKNVLDPLSYKEFDQMWLLVTRFKVGHGLHLFLVE